MPIFVGAMSFAARAEIDKVARDGDMADGEVYIFNDRNDPNDCGTHLCDFKLVAVPPGATTLVDPDLMAEVDRFGNLIIGSA